MTFRYSIDHLGQEPCTLQPFSGWLGALCLALVAWGAFIPAAAHAVPAAVPYVGHLTEDDGTPINGPVDLRVTLYTHISERDAVWGPHDFLGVEVVFGVLSVVLGGGGSPPIEADDLGDGEALWLEVEVDGTLLTPRQEVLSVPYALRADDTKRLGGTPADFYVTQDGLNDFEGFIRDELLASVALSGNYRDLAGLPDLGSYLTADELAAVAFSGAYADLVGLPDLADFLTGEELAAVAHSGAYSDLFGLPDLSAFITADDLAIVEGDQMVTGDLTVGGDQIVVGHLTVGGTDVEATFAAMEDDLQELRDHVQDDSRHLTEETVAAMVADAIASGGDLSNLVHNGAFDSPAIFHFYPRYGDGLGGSIELTDNPAPLFGTQSLRLVDDDINHTVAVYQDAIPPGQGAGYRGRTFTAGVHVLREAGTAQGRLCIADAGEPGAEPAASVSCVDLPADGQWRRVTVTHTVSQEPEYLRVILASTQGPEEMATYLFDGLMLNEGTFAAPWRPHMQERANARGTIVMWSGELSQIPRGWALCDGQFGTPDLIDRFVAGIPNPGTAPGATGGTHQRTLTRDQLPSHTHTATSGSAGRHTHQADTTLAGYHDHTGRTDDSGSHTHNHRRYNERDMNGVGYVRSATPSVHNTFTTQPSGNHWHWLNIDPGGAHSHGVEVDTVAAHTHSVTVNSAGGGMPFDNRPRYYALAFIMKL